jgi:hypothetical protein
VNIGKYSRALLILSAPLLLAGGCSSSTTGTRIDHVRLDNIQKGVTTRAEVEAMFGPPASLSIAPDGKRTAFWQYTEAEGRVKGTSFIPFAGAFMGGTTAEARTQSLQVIYTREEVVDDFVFSGNTTQTDTSSNPWSGRTNTRTTAEQPASAR